MAAPLEGIRVLDFTRYQQGPFATVILADFGADVVKVEEPNGDYGRRMWREADGFSAFWEALDRGKKSVCIDLRQPEGCDLALLLADRADVLVENFRPGTMEKWGLGPDVVLARNPRIIYARATGWGSKGPMAGLPSFDQIAQAFSGFAQHSGGGPGHRPEVPYPGIADQTGGMNLALGIMTALFVRERTGKGQVVEVSLLGTQLALQAPELLHVLHFGEERPREFRAAPTVGHYRCSDDRWVMIVGIDQKFWPRIARALGLDHLVDDPRFARGGARYRNRAELEAIMEAAFAANTSAHWLERLRAEDVPASLVQEYRELAESEQPWANGYLAEQDHPRFGRQRVVGPHIQLSETPPRLAFPARDLGVDTESVLAELGLDADTIASLKQRGVIGPAPAAVRSASPGGAN
ncbi:CoA transferase [Tepidiforma sp.]|uniref:CaiB/BaiF CoA transferase family protein n=1 Tax=Tepidiforma sp. TaxID=2682230 RepID=UPI002ADD337C|nr:CoA transferase [Tepidiforma sp.]